MTQSCPTCGASVLATARFCSRCGAPIEGGPSGKAHDARAGVPWAGILFLLGIVFAPAAVASGVWWDYSALVWAGIVVAVAIVLVVILGMLF